MIDDLHAVLDEPIKIVGVSEDRSLVARCESELNARLGAEASAARSTPFYLDVTHPEANKGMVVREASRILEIPLEQIATIGDMPNDVPMLSIAGLSIAMGNASADVQRVARHVTRSNEEDGFAYAVDTFILGAPPFAQTPLGPAAARARLPLRPRRCPDPERAAPCRGLEAPLRPLPAQARARGRPAVRPLRLLHDYGRNFDGNLPSTAFASFLVARGVELPEQTVAALVDRKGEIFVDLLAAERLESYEGSVRYLELAREAGLRIGVVSSSTHCREALRSAGIADLCESGSTARSPPPSTSWASRRPDTFLAAARALGRRARADGHLRRRAAGVAAGRRGHFGYVVGVDRLGRARRAAAARRRRGGDRPRRAAGAGGLGRRRRQSLPVALAAQRTTHNGEPTLIGRLTAAAKGRRLSGS